MAETKTMNVRFQQKYDTAANWADSTIQLLAGEIAVESDTGKFKFGNGTDVFADLPYAGIDQAQLDAIEDNYYHVVPTIPEGATAIETDAEALARVIANPKKGDIAVVERAIGELTSASSMTAYVYSGTAWAAMDGNYDASNVYFDSDLTYTASIGALKLADGKSSDTYAAKGKSLEEVIKRLMAETIAPTITQPSYSLDSVTADVSSTVEIGTKVKALKWNATFTDGSYSYKSVEAPSSTAAGCTVTYSMSCDKDGSTNTPTAEDGTFTLTTAHQVTKTTAETVGTITTTCVISDSPRTPVNNIGEAVDGKITGKTVEKSGSFSVTGYRAWFCGYKDGSGIIKKDDVKDATAITGAQVRALGTSKNGSWSSSMNVTGMQQMFFAAPAGKGYKPVIKDSKTGAPQTVKGPITVSVEGANNYDAIDYDVWYVDNDFPASGSATLNITKS